MSVCVLITIFARYADPERFPFSGYFNIGMTYLFSFMSIGVLSIDLGFSLYNKETDNKEEQESYHTLMRILWNLIYWGSLLHGTVLKNFYAKYWTSGHFTVGGRVKHALKVRILNL